MSITQKSIKILWSAAAGLCAFPNCRERLCYSGAGDQTPYTLGEMAHICGDQPGSNRHDASQNQQARDDYANLILLCPTHHALVDRVENEGLFTAEALHRFKTDHERYVREHLVPQPSDDKRAIATEIAPMLTQNHQAWSTYGPLSNFARKDPHSMSAHAVWLSERLSTIVPNNRRIADLLRDGMKAFNPTEQKLISEFGLHVRSYEMWVADEISYNGVMRFPVAFSELIEGIASASA